MIYEGKFARIKSNNKGQAFSSSLAFRTPIDTTAGNYSLSMYTLINCGIDECAFIAKDKITVKIKDGENGEFTELDTLANRSVDDRWYRENFIFNVRNDKIWVKYL